MFLVFEYADGLKIGLFKPWLMSVLTLSLTFYYYQIVYFAPEILIGS